jgi:hypothetical protein
MEEDLAPQKIKAIKYLATIGCGCYDKKIDPPVKKALMAALDDCTEEVRYEAVKALIEAAEDHCTTCNRDCCCDEELTLKLAEIAYERDDKCCYKEPSERVREAAAEAMRACCPGRGPVNPTMVLPPPAATPEAPLPPRPEAPIPPPATTRRNAIGTPENGMVVLFGEPALAGEQMPARPVAPRRTVSHSAANTNGMVHTQPASMVRLPVNVEGSAEEVGHSTMVPGKSASVLQVSVVEEAEEPAPLAQVAVQQPRYNAAQAKGSEGTIAKVAGSAGTVQVQFPRSAKPQVGARIKVFHRFLLSEACIGEMEIVAVGDGAVTARPLADCNLNKLAAGDRAVLAGMPQRPVTVAMESAAATDRQ